MNAAFCRFALLIPLALACFALAPQMQGQCVDGCGTNFNTFQGEQAFQGDGGIGNSAFGWQALFSNTTGYYNTAIGSSALTNNISGSNTATGFEALMNNTRGTENCAFGKDALVLNGGDGSGADNNNAFGDFALSNNIRGTSNVAVGYSTLFFNASGNDNTAIGNNALSHTTTGSNNTANGFNALSNNTGSNNVGLGFNAGLNLTTGDNNIVLGYEAGLNVTTGSNNIALGSEAGYNRLTGSNNIDIGSRGVARESNSIRIGSPIHRATFIAGISGTTVPTGIPVIVDGSDHLGTTTSSARFKEAIKPMDKASETILALKPVTFSYKHELDPDAVPQFGLIAEEVQKINPDLVACDEQGKPYTVRYDAVNAMLLNEFLKEHKTVQEQGATITELKKQIAALTAGLEKVSAQLAVSKSAPQTVLNNQ